MRLKQLSTAVTESNKGRAICNNIGLGPTFGWRAGGPFGPNYDLCVNGTALTFYPGSTYDSPGAAVLGQLRGDYVIEELEVFQVTETSPSLPSARGDTRAREDAGRQSKEPVLMAETNSFSTRINDALNAKLRALKYAEEDMSALENSLDEEEQFICSFASGETKDVITLNVGGTAIATRRATLRVFEESVLARQFDDTTWTDQGKEVHPVEEWTSEEVRAWIENIAGIPEDVAGVFGENDITGRELVALGAEGLKTLGVERTGTRYLLLDEVRKLSEARAGAPPLIEHSPYCFGKIVDYLRLRQLHSLGLAEEPALPKVCPSQQDKFEITVNYFFPGESSRLILG